MSNRKIAKAIQNLAREIQKLHRQFNRAVINWLLRSAFVANRRGSSPMAGFVLPTAVLLLLVLTLTVGAMTLRAFDRNTQVITSAQEKVVYNAATPAIDRARSKLEFLFDPSKDARYPGGTPFESYLVGMLANDGATNGVARFTIDDGSGNQIDPYNLPDETRVSLGGANSGDTAWRYRADTNGDGTQDATVIYSVIFKTPSAQGNLTAPQRLITMSDQEKATEGVVRNGPLSSQTKLTGCSTAAQGSEGGFTQEGWFEDTGNTSVIRKNFQVNALVIPDNPKLATVTLEFQQDRQINRGNKWGAWFRYDIEVFPGPQFNWNGAMHTEGNMFLAGSNFNAYLISSPASCLFQPESSELSITNQTDPIRGLGDFQGVVAMGHIGKNPQRTGNAAIHAQTGATTYVTNPTVTQTNDAATAGSVQALASDPVAIVLEERTRSVNPDTTNRSVSAWQGVANRMPAPLGGAAGRFRNKAEKVPFVDDLYRADDRWGPKPKYFDDATGANLGRVPAGVAIGTDITGGGAAALTATPTPTGNAPTSVGFDGYWERRAYSEGMRLLVGERLELGNIGGWVTPRDVNRNNVIELPAFSATNPAPLLTERTAPTPAALTELEGDPLYPPTVAPYPVRTVGGTISHLTQQRRSLRDNIPAVQSAAVYHAAVGRKDYPVACVAMTVHPGTQNTLRQSTNFFPTSYKNNNSPDNTILLSDFFNGRGTDGWEYTPPGGDFAQFVSQLAPNQPLRIALENLANFAGDKDGAFPPVQEAGRIHPYPALTMWGNYSNLRRALAKLDAVGYERLSLADKSYIQTAACTLGMLATNIDQLQKFDPTNPGNDFEWNNAPQKVMTDLANELYLLMDGRVDNGEVLPQARLATYSYSPTGAYVPSSYEPSDYYEVPPEAFLAGLKQKAVSLGIDYLNSPVIRMAELIMTSQQTRRDRTFGFRPSPAFGEYAVLLNSAAQVFPTACDPDLFTLEDATVASRYTPANQFDQRRQPSVDPATWQLRPFAANPANYPTPASLPGAVGTGSGAGSLGVRRLALSRLCGAIRVPRGYQPGTQLSNTGDIALRPTVLPKFPSLYYIFPEVPHGITGTPLVGDANNNGKADEPGAYDARQPGAIGPNGSISTAVGAANDAAAAAVGVNPFDREPYVTDNYINTANSPGAALFRPVSPGVSPNLRLGAYPTPTDGTATVARTTNTYALGPGSKVGIAAGVSFFARFPYANSSPFPVPDLPVSSLALAPRRINGFPATAVGDAVLPNYAPRNFTNDTSPNRIMVPSSPNVVATQVRTPDQLPTTPWAVPFLDRAMFDGRQLEVARVTDVDWGMLRSTNPGGQTDENTEFAPNEPWLPMSGIVYAFREDAVREDAIARPPGGPIPATGVTNAQLIAGNSMNVTNPAAPFDPPVQADRNRISVKTIDHQPDPDRRVHGFRMRNGTQLKRNPAVVAGIEDAASKNIRGLSFITDQPVYIQGDFNLHQPGDGSQNDRATNAQLLEEFTEPLFDQGVYNPGKFYGRTTKNPNFASPNGDRWRPSEILADSISILSDNFCDGSIADAFVAPTPNPNTIPDFQASNGGGGGIQYPGNIQRSNYNERGLYAPGCRTGAGNTSYQNQNRVNAAPPSNGQGWEWKREGASFVSRNGINGNQPTWSDFTTPIQIGRSGEPLVIARPTGQNPTLPVNYGTGGLGLGYAAPQDGRGIRAVADAAETRINSIIISGLSPSRPNQSYGGLHNFPRFLEVWGNNNPFYFSGSFLQLNFSNYATGPFEQEGWEPGQGATAAEPIPHYNPPARLWGYDVALQFAPAGPIAARFVTPASTRSEFYTEPPATDPYINKLCNAAKQVAGVLPAQTQAQLNCVAQQ